MCLWRGIRIQRAFVFLASLRMFSSPGSAGDLETWRPGDRKSLDHWERDEFLEDLGWFHGRKVARGLPQIVQEVQRNQIGARLKPSSHPTPVQMPECHMPFLLSSKAWLASGVVNI